MSGIRTNWAALAAMLGFSAAAWGQGGPPGGSIADLLISPNNLNVIFAATPSGVFRSDNRGGSWRAINEGLTTVDVEALSESPEYLFAATFGGGIFRSADGGASWSAINEGLDNLFAQSIAVAPSDPNFLYAGFFTGATMTGAMFKSTNAGDSWTAVRTGLTDGSYLDIAIHPANPDIVYAANTSAASNNVGALFRTIDGGASWAGSASQAGVTAVAIDSQTPETVYVGTTQAIVKTTTSGASFQPVLTGLTVRGLAIDPTNSQVIYAGTRLSSLIRSTDGGANWFAVSSGLPQAEVFSVAVDPANGERVYCGLDASGVFLSTDNASSWQFSSAGLFAADVRAIAIDPGDSNTAYASLYGGIVFRTTDGGMTWNQARQGLTATNVVDLAVAPTSSSTVLAGSVNPFVSQILGGDGAVFRSTDRGGNWTGIATGVPFRRVLPHPSNASTIFLGSDAGVFRSTNGGQEFNPRSNGLLIDQVTDLVFDPTDSDTLFALGIDNFNGVYSLYRTTNSGGDWRGFIFTGLPLLNVAVDPNNRDRVFMGTTTGVVRSTNRGESFNNASEGLPVAQINSLAIDGRASSAMYAATVDTANSVAAIYRSTNRGDNWVVSNNGLGNKFVRRLAIDRSQAGVLWAATAGFGVYKTTDGGASWVAAGVAPGEVPIVPAAGIVGAFDFMGGGVAPGAIISIFGQKMGPEAGVEAQIDPDTGKLRTLLAGVRVRFNGHEAALFFVRADQINAQVPFEVGGLASVEVVVEYNGVPSAPAVVGAVDTHPELHPNISNLPSFTINSDANRVAKGGFASVFATGHGLLAAEVETGALTPPTGPFPEPLLPVSISIGGQPAQVLFSGLAPGFAGLLQVNLVVPQGVASGPNEVVLKIGDKTAAVSRTLFVE